MLSRDSFNKEGVGRTLAYLQFPIKFLKWGKATYLVMFPAMLPDFPLPKALGCNRGVSLCSHQCVHTHFPRFHRRGWYPKEKILTLLFKTFTTLNGRGVRVDVLTEERDKSTTYVELIIQLIII